MRYFVTRFFLYFLPSEAIVPAFFRVINLNKNNMEKQIQVTVELSIVAGKTSEVKQQIPALVQMVKMTGSECISYEWFLNEKKNKYYFLII